MKRGFTLIELLIVIAILGILVALILPRFGDIRTDANTKVCVANLRGLVSAMTTYETKENTSVTWGGAATGADDLALWGYIASEPFCPYEVSAGTNTPYTLAPGASDTVSDAAECPQDTTHTDHVWP